jgi:hypothetical protein
MGFARVGARINRDKVQPGDAHENLVPGCPDAGFKGKGKLFCLIIDLSDQLEWYYAD